MPKMQPFYKFMMVQEKNFRNPNGSKLSKVELQKACAPLWEAMSPEERAVYKTKEQMVHKAGNRPAVKLDSRGIPLADIEKKRKDASKYEKEMKSYIDCWLDALNDGQGIQKGVFFILSVLNFVEESAKVIPAEVGIVKVSLEHGIIDEFHYLFKPSIIPAGYAATAFDIRNNSHHLPTDMTDEDDDYPLFSAKFRSFIQDEGSEAPLYTLWTNYKMIRRSLEYVDEDLERVRIYSLPALLSVMFRLVNLQALSPMADLLGSSDFDYEVTTGCKWHQTKYSDGLAYCALGKCQRWFFLMCSSLNISKTLKIKLLPFKHKPGQSLNTEDLSRAAISQETKSQKVEQMARTSAWCNYAESASNDMENLNLTNEEQFPSLSASTGRGQPAMRGVGSRKKQKPVGIGRGRMNQ